ncbi:MAG: LysR family transcriptional regulator [Myxococcaceae bacterium]|nr:LysR family transcriptional regulator [Myxococcaceae bacterium]
MDRLEALRLFVRVAERGSFSAAARDLRVKQSTASKWVAELERQLGLGLVERTTRALHLTDDGRRFLAHAQQVLASWDELVEQLQERTPEPVGRLRVSVPVVFGQRFVVPLVGAFVEANPRVDLQLVFGDRFVNLVDDGFDLAIRVGVSPDASFRVRKLADGGRSVVAAKRYLDARGWPKRPADLERHDCLIHSDAEPSVIWRFGTRGGDEVPVRVRGRVSVTTSEAALALAKQGLGIALLADWLVEPEVAAGRLVKLLERATTPPAPVYAVLPPGRYTPRLTRLFVDHLAAAFARTLGAGRRP